MLFETLPETQRRIVAAARLGQYFLGHALAVFDQMAADPPVEDAHAVLEWIARTHPDRFSRRVAFTGLSRSRFRKIADLDPALHAARRPRLHPP